MAPSSRRLRTFLAMALLIGAAAVGLAGPAGASGPRMAPYGATTITFTVSTTNPTPGQGIIGTVTQAGPGDSIDIVIDSTPIMLARLVADPNGEASTTLAIPCDFTGAHTIVATDRVTGASAAVPVTVASATSAFGCLVASKTLATTGTDVIAIGASALGLLAAGGLVIYVSRRRPKQFR
jgi:hypothetical protein